MSEKVREPKLKEVEAYIDNYIDMGHFRNPDQARPYLIDGFIHGYKKAFEASAVSELVAALEYYAHPDHYEETQRLHGIDKPGVLTERGKKARQALSKFRGGK